MRLAPALSILFAATQQATAQYFIDYFAVGTSGCTGQRRTCSNIPSGTCCLLGDWAPFWWGPARTGSWGAPGFTVWTQTNDFGEYCGRCRTTTSFGCWVNNNPFDLAFIVGLSTTCNAGVLRRATVDTDASGNTTALAAGGEVAEGCTAYALPDLLGYDGNDYVITDKNRKEIEGDFRALLEGTRKLDFAGKWKSALIGPTEELHSASGEDLVAKEKPKADSA